MRSAAIVALAAALVSTAAVAATQKARVAVVSKAPVSVAGNGFRSRERVTVTFTARSTYKKALTANVRGAFTAKFAGVSIGYCEAYTVRAKGNRGSLAVVNVIPDCPNMIPRHEYLFAHDPPPKKLP